MGDLHLNRLTRRVTKGTSILDVTPMELRLLEHLMLHAGQVVTRSELHEKVWDMHFDPSSNLVDAHVARLRKKLNVVTNSLLLETRRGMGNSVNQGNPGGPEVFHPLVRAFCYTVICSHRQLRRQTVVGPASMICSAKLRVRRRLPCGNHCP